MKKRKQKDLDVRIETMNYSMLNSLFNPTVYMAAELMNVSAEVVEEWLAQERFTLVGGDRLTDSAIDFLAKKYVERLHKYFDNCNAVWNTLNSNEQQLFYEFVAKYGKYFRFWVREWKDIDSKRIAKDFKDELSRKAHDDFFEGFESFEFPRIVIPVKTVEAQFSFDYLYDKVRTRESSTLFFAITHSLYYGSRIKTKIPGRPEYRNIVLEILQENRFHIFTGESDSNALIDAFLFTNVKQLQLAIAFVFGYLRHKNYSLHGNKKKTSAYCYS